MLSVDDYAPNEGNRYYNYKEQGLVADYVMLMQYNEHWSGSDAGSVASATFVATGIDNTVALGVPENKRISILPFYTRIWKTERIRTLLQKKRSKSIFRNISRHANGSAMQDGKAL